MSTQFWLVIAEKVICLIDGKAVMQYTETPIELLVLGALQYLGRGLTFDDIEEATAISAEVHDVFFHVFIDFSSTLLYSKYVIVPSIHDVAKRYMKEFMMAGMPGCVGSMDATHITMWVCGHNLCNHRLGGKSKFTTRSYNMNVNYRRRMLHSTCSGPGCWNDKMMVMFDKFVKGIHDRDYFQDI